MKFKSGFVSIVGRPNVGKSTLINTIVGHKVAITSDKPQTTRDQILAVKTEERGQIIFLDNPGIHKPLHKLNENMMELVYHALEEADLILFMVDLTQKWGRGDDFALELVKKYEKTRFAVVNKVDALKKSKALPLMEKLSSYGIFDEIIPISAKTGDNVSLLIDKIFEYLPEGEMLYPEDMVTNIRRKFFVAEIIREKILRTTRDEIPYGVAVMVNTIEPRNGVVYISADIIVERESHKKIIIGKKGEMIKKIGKSAREELEMIVGKKIYLELFVKVKEKWRDSDSILTILEMQKGED